MPLFTLLDTAIGLVLVFSLLSLLVSSIGESISQLLALRGKVLLAGIAGMVSDAKLRDQFLIHPLIRALGQPRRNGTWRPPSYIPADLFVTALLDSARRVEESDDPPKPVQDTFEDLQDLIGKLPEGATREALIALIKNGEQNVGAAQKRFERWFNQTMDRTSGWYRRRMRLVLLAVSAVIVVPLNLDTVEMAETLWTSPAIRAGMVATATQQVAQSDSANSAESAPAVDRMVQDFRRLAALDVPLGWSRDDDRTVAGSPGGAVKTSHEWTFQEVTAKIFGLLVTILAASLGATFWFDVLKQLIRIRAAGPPPAESEAS